MRSGDGISKGLGACEEALQRLLAGKPVVSEHVGLDLSKLTASIVSLEAGFDRGYLKKSRKTHLPLLAQIEAVRAEASKGGGIERQTDPADGKSAGSAGKNAINRSDAA